MAHHASPSPFNDHETTTCSRAIHDATLYQLFDTCDDQELEGSHSCTVRLRDSAATASTQQQQPRGSLELLTDFSRSDENGTVSGSEEDHSHNVPSKPFLPRFSSIDRCIAFIGKDESQQPVSAHSQTSQDPVAWRDIPHRSQLIVS